MHGRIDTVQWWQALRRLARRLVIATLVVAGVFVSVAAEAQTFRFSGFLIARGIETRSQPSWLSGGFGRLDTGARRSNDSKTTALEVAQLGADWTPTQWFDAHVQGIARHDAPGSGGRPVGLIEAYADLRKDFGSSELQLRVGQFFLPTSRENTDNLWTSPYTITLSALNTWIGEEFRPIGGELQWKKLTSTTVWTFAGGAFRGNDTSGALLGWRGWSLGSRLTTYGEVLPLPPLFSLRDPRAFADQRRDGTNPFGPDLDGRTGITARVRMQIPERALVQLAHIDNRGDRREYRKEYAWQTRFNIASGEITTVRHATIAAEYGWGSTGMGFAPAALVNLNFAAWYALISQPLGRNRLSARYDGFRTIDRDHSFAENNTEHGRAWTLAWFFEPRPSVRLGAEFASVSARRIAAAESGFDPNTDGRTLTLEARYRF